VTGLRVDHTDGLAERGEYFRSVRNGLFLHWHDHERASDEGWRKRLRDSIEP